MAFKVFLVYRMEFNLFTRFLLSDPEILFQPSLLSLVYTCHIFCIHSFVTGHLGCSCVLVIVTSAAMNIGMHVSI